MVPEVSILNEKTAEFTLTAACPACGGDLRLRLSPEGARSWCPTCHLIGRPRVRFGPDGLVVVPDGQAQA